MFLRWIKSRNTIIRYSKSKVCPFIFGIVYDGSRLPPFRIFLDLHSANVP